MAHPEITLIVPCFNEATRLDTAAFLRFADLNPTIHFLFVDDGSSDGTCKVLQSLSTQKPERFSALILEKNSGKAEAVRKGMNQAVGNGSPFVGFWDADLATPLEIIPDFMRIPQLRPNIEIVMGSRVKLLGHDIERSLVRHYLGRVFATCASGALNLDVYDTQCGAKIFRNNNLLKQVLAEPFHSRWIFDVEMLARYKKIKGWSKKEAEQFIYELPLSTWKDIAGSKVKPTDFFKAMGELAVIYRTYR